MFTEKTLNSLEFFTSTNSNLHVTALLMSLEFGKHYFTSTIVADGGLVFRLIS